MDRDTHDCLFAIHAEAVDLQRRTLQIALDDKVTQNRITQLVDAASNVLRYAKQLDKHVASDQASTRKMRFGYTHERYRSEAMNAARQAAKELNHETGQPHSFKHDPVGAYYVFALDLDGGSK